MRQVDGREGPMTSETSTIEPAFRCECVCVCACVCVCVCVAWPECTVQCIILGAYL